MVFLPFLFVLDGCSPVSLAFLQFQLVYYRFETVLVAFQYLPPGLGPALGRLFPGVENRPKIGSWGFHAFENNRVLAVVMPMGMVEVECFEGEDVEGVVEEVCALVQADEAEVDGVVGRRVVAVEDVIARRSRSGCGKRYLDKHVGHVLGPLIHRKQPDSTVMLRHLF